MYNVCERVGVLITVHPFTVSRILHALKTGLSRYASPSRCSVIILLAAFHPNAITHRDFQKINATRKTVMTVQTVADSHEKNIK